MARKEDLFISPQTCDVCESAPQGKHCFSKFNCLLYSGTADLNLDRIAEDAASYNPMSDWERDVEELKMLIEKGA